MPPFTITASPFAAALAALLLSSTSSSLQKKKKKKEKQLKQDKNKLEHKQCTWKKKKKVKTAQEGTWECVWGSDSPVGGSHYLSFIS